MRDTPIFFTLLICFSIVALAIPPFEAYQCSDHCEEPFPSIYAGNNSLWGCDSKNRSILAKFCDQKDTIEFVVDTFNCLINEEEIGIYHTGSCGCPNYCYEYENRGKCVNNNCICNSGWKGSDCSLLDCSTNNTYSACSNRGTCKTVNEKDVCICDNGYTGLNCSEVLKPIPALQNFLPYNQYSSWDSYGNNNPLFYMNELSLIHIEMSSADYQNLLTPANKNDDTYFPGSVQFYNRNASVLMEEVGIRIKGGISRSFVKKSWKLKLNSAKGTQYFQQKKIVLKTSVFDCVLLREMLSVRLAYSIGIPVQRTSFSNVWVNGENYGVYLTMENIDEQFLKSRFGSKADNFPLYKALGLLTYLGDNPVTYKELNATFLGRLHYIYDPQTPAAESIEEGYTPLVQLIKAFNQTGSAFETEITKVFDVEMFLKVIALEIFTGQIDGFTGGNNFFLYRGSNGLWQLFRQDFDISFGLFQNVDLKPPVSEFNIFCNDTFYGPGQEIFKKFLSVPSFRASYVQIWKAILSQLMDPINGIMVFARNVHQKNAVQIYQDIWRQMDFGWPYQFFVENLDNTIPIQGAPVEIDGIVTYITNRYKSALAQIQEYEKTN